MEPAFFNILLQADYKSIINACKADPRFFKICRSPYFWQEKALLDFSIDPEAFKSITARDNKARYEYLMYVEKNRGLVNAAKEDKKKLVEYFVDLGADYYNGAMSDAAFEGHMDIVKLMVSLGANNYNEVMCSAAQGGHIDIVKLMISLGANDYDIAEIGAEYEGHMDIIELLRQYM